MKVQVLVADVGHPVQVTVNAVRETMSPSTHQHRANHFKREVREYRHAECRRHVIAHAQLATNFNFTQHPRHERTQRANGNELPQSAFHQRRKAQAVGKIGRCNIDLPQIPARPLRGAPQNHGCA